MCWFFFQLEEEKVNESLQWLYLQWIWEKWEPDSSQRCTAKSCSRGPGIRGENKEKLKKLLHLRPFTWENGQINICMNFQILTGRGHKLPYLTLKLGFEQRLNLLVSRAPFQTIYMIMLWFWAVRHVAT